MPDTVTIVWFRNDLRLADNRALVRAVAEGGRVVPVYILDDETPGIWCAGGASRWWLHHSLMALREDLEAIGSRLILRRGKAIEVLVQLAQECKACAVYASRAYQPWAGPLEAEVKARLDKDGVTFRRFMGSLLFEPEAVKTKEGGPFKVYTPFWRAAIAGPEVHKPQAAPKKIAEPSSWPNSEKLEAWKLLPTKPDWAGGMRAAWTPGAAGAQARLKSFLKSALGGYADGRNRPDLPSTSRLSPHLAFGEISPATVWYAARLFAHDKPALDRGLEVFCKELVWREFSYHLLSHWPALPEAPFRAEFAQFPWLDAPDALRTWQRGMTGYPIVDAGMRELWHTGYMHNRVRMVVSSFLVKDLLIPWQQGEAWFWDTLVDADLASNAASWQWVAGSGADAAPYFRVFNPVKQGETFDPDGTYVRRWVPELARLPSELLHKPWEATDLELQAAGVKLGTDYPAPIVDHAMARDRALTAYKEIKAG